MLCSDRISRGYGVDILGVVVVGGGAVAQLAEASGSGRAVIASIRVICGSRLTAGRLGIELPLNKLAIRFADDRVVAMAFILRYHH